MSTIFRKFSSSATYSIMMIRQQKWRYLKNFWANYQFALFSFFSNCRHFLSGFPDSPGARLLVAKIGKDESNIENEIKKGIHDSQDDRSLSIHFQDESNPDVNCGGFEDKERQGNKEGVRPDINTYGQKFEEMEADGVSVEDGSELLDEFLEMGFVDVVEVETAIGGGGHFVGCVVMHGEHGAEHGGDLKGGGDDKNNRQDDEAVDVHFCSERGGRIIRARKDNRNEVFGSGEPVRVAPLYRGRATYAEWARARWGMGTCSITGGRV